MKAHLVYLAVIGTGLVSATPALADAATDLPGPGVFGLVALGVVAAIAIARRRD